MQNIFLLARKFLTQENPSLLASLFLVTCLAILAGCGSGPAAPKDTTSGTTTGTSGTTGTAGTTATNTNPFAPSFTLALTDAAGASVSSIANGAPATLKATLKFSSGIAIPNTVVTFSTDAALATIAPAATALTDASGVATVTLSPATILTAGATTVKASAQVGTDAVSNSIGFTVGTAVVSVSAPVLGVATLSAFGTTSIDVTVSVGGVPVTTPQNVTFSSVCANIGKAVLSTGAVTATGGVARGSYRDNGCAGTDIITASAAGVTSASTNLVVTPPATGSIQFVSASPSSISLKGIGGTEASLVSFKVLDASGNPLAGKTVAFDLSTRVGGIALIPSDSLGIGTATSDAAGLVVITVNSGTVSTPVRVTASTIDSSTVPATTLTTQSSGLVISTGIPDQDSFSLSATTLNPEFGNIDGNTTIFTVRLADHFNNPVPAGTVVSFTTEGGAIVASCSTVIDGNGNSNCSATLTSQDPRPPNGRVTVLAYAVGEESFTDLNGNGVADLLPVNEVTDLGEAFRDDNENGVRDANEPFIDFNQNGVYDTPDGKYSGVLCDSAKSSAGTCSTTKSFHVRKQIVIVFAGSTASITLPAAIDLNAGGGLPGCGSPQNISIGVVNSTGNVMPAGTTIEVKTTNGTLGINRFVVANTNQLVTPPYITTIQGDGAAASGACTDTTATGVLTVTVTTPGGTITTKTTNVTN